MKRRTKTASEVLDYIEDWEDWLSGDTIFSASWALDTGLTEDLESNTTLVSTVWISGGTLGTHYVCTNTIVTVAGRTGIRSFLLEIIEK